jgi:mannose-6-phosphate isomerase
MEGKSSLLEDGTPFNNFFSNNRSLFNDYQGNYPLLAKILDCNQDLSVQVHPTEKYCQTHKDAYIKSEA